MEHLLNLLYVIGRPGDQGRRPKLAELPWGELANPAEDGETQIPPETA
jgi:hypothetical protein